MPITAAGISAAAALGATATGAAGAIVGGGGPQGQLRFPPELELQFLEQNQQIVDQSQVDLQRTSELEAAYNSRLDTVDQIINGAIPDQDALRQLGEQSVQIAKAFGGNVEEAINSGFLTDFDKTTIDQQQQEIEKLRGLEDKNFRDPALEDKLNKDKQALEQDLARAGVSPAQRAAALRRFENVSEQERFTRANELRNQATQRGLSRIGAITSVGQFGLSARQQGFDIASGSAANLRATLEQERGATAQAIQGLVGTAGARLAAGSQAIESRRGLRQDTLSAFGQLGSTEFSENTRDALEAGLIGPGTFKEQTGVSRGSVDAYVEAQNRAIESRDRAAIDEIRNRLSGSPLSITSADEFRTAFQGVDVNRALERSLRRRPPL